MEDSARVVAYNAYIFNGFIFSNPDSAFSLADNLIAFGEERQNSMAIGAGYNLQGISWHIRGDLPNALGYFTRSANIYEESGDKLGLSSALSNIGNIYRDQGNYVKAIDNYTQAAEIYQAIGELSGTASSLNSIGLIYGFQGNYLKALDYISKSLKKYEGVKDKGGMARTLNNIGKIYSDEKEYEKALEYYNQSLKLHQEAGNKLMIAVQLNNMGESYLALGNQLKALEYLEQSLNIRREVQDKNGIANSLLNIGGLFLIQKDYPKATELLEMSQQIYQELRDKKGIANTLNAIGHIFQEQGLHKQAISKCQQALRLSKEIGALGTQKEACICLFDAYKAQNNGNIALKYHEQIYRLDDSLQAEETGKKLQQMEFEKLMIQDSISKAEEARLVREAHEVEMRQQKQKRNLSYVVGFIFLLFAGGFYSRWRYVRKSRDIISKERDRSENLLLNILPEEIAAELKEKGRADARDFDLVSILFTDFKGFTSASEKLSAQDLVAEINTCFKAFDDIISKFGIEKIKTIGDAYMAAGGLPVPDNESVKNTVLAALEMQAYILDRKQKLDDEGLPSFEMRAGVHTGPVVAGIVGVKKFQYDIWGDTVNTASRMESSGEVGQVNISQATYEILKDEPDLSFEQRGKIQAKGKGEIEMYFVKKRN